MSGFREYMHRTGHLDFKHLPARHHEVIIAALEALEADETTRLLLMLPPGGAKSTYASVQFICWYLARHTDHNVLCCSNSQSLAESFQRRRRQALYSQEWQALAGTKIDPQNQGLERFGLLTGGTCTAAGVGSSIIGLRANLLVLDDPITSIAEAMSETQLQKIWSWYTTDARSRLVPSGKELIITTRWSRNDPAGQILRLIESGAEAEWQVIRLPMLCDDPENDPLGRQLGEQLWPEWFTQEQIDRAQRNALTWSALYQQTPLNASGSWVPLEHIQYEDQAPDALRVVMAIDLALSQGRGDYTAIIVVGVDSDRKLHILHVHRERTTADHILSRLFDLQEQYRPEVILIDDDPAATVFTRLAYQLGRQRGEHLPLRPVRIAGRDKETRAASIRAQFHMGNVFLLRAAWNLGLIEETMEFPNGSHDDQIDALSLVGREMHKLSLPRAVATTTPELPLQGLVSERGDGKLILNVTLDQLFEDRENALSRKDATRIR